MSNDVLEKLVLGPFQSNCYLIGGADSDELLIIDPGAEPERIMNVIESSDRSPAEIWATHGHIDHVGAVQPLKEEYDLPFFVHRDDEGLVRNIDQQANAFGLPSLPEPTIDGYLEENTRERRCGIELELRPTPGHSPGGLTFVDEVRDRAFVGDCVFAGSIGRTDFPNADHDTLLASIKGEILTLPEDSTLYPGHGPETTVGKERRSNPHLQNMRMPP